MRTLSSSLLLDLWEATLGEPPDVAALRLLSAAHPELGLDGVAALPIGRRDAALLEIWEQSFGGRLIGTSRCQECGENAEITFDVDQIRIQPPDSPDLSIVVGDRVVAFRLPTTSDLLAARSLTTVDEVRRALIQSCVLPSDGELAAPAIADLSEDSIERVEAAMAAADPQADIQLNLECPACRSPSSISFDIVTFLLGDIDAWARRTLHEVALLASSFGWRESDVLALSPHRRQYYLAAVGQ